MLPSIPVSCSLDERMDMVPLNRYRPGTWEFSAASVYWDAHYQAGLFFLSYAVGMWNTTPRAEQRPHLLPALRNVRATNHGQINVEMFLTLRANLEGPKKDLLSRLLSYGVKVRFLS